MNEIELLKELEKINSPYILKLHEHSINEKNNNIVLHLEYGECTLNDLIKEKISFEPDEILDIV
jgi:hypothetical protein